MVEYAHFIGLRLPGVRGFDVAGAGALSPPAAAAPSPAAGAKPRREAFSIAQKALLFAAFACVAALPVVSYPLPPISDYVNHLSRMYVIATLDSDSDLARFYQVNWQVIPNLLMDIILPVLVRFMSVYTAGQAYMIASFVVILSGTFALNRQLHGRWCVLPLAAFPLLYNYIFLIGTMNYVSGIGVSLWALAAWAALREGHAALRLTVSALFVLVLFFCHLFVVGTYGLGLLTYELHRLWSVRGAGTAPPFQGGALRRRLCDFVATGVPFAPVLPLLMMSPTWGLRGEMSWEFSGKGEGLLYVIETYSPAVALVIATVAVLGAGYALHRRALRFHPFGMVLLAVGTTVYLAMPRIIFDTYMADQRLPIWLAFMVIACAQLDFVRLGPAARWGAALVLFGLLALRVIEVQAAWASLTPGMASFRGSVELIDRGAKVMVAYADPDGGDDVRDLGLVHAACLAVIERSALVTSVFTVVGKQVLHARADYRDRVDTQDGSPPTVENLLRVVDQEDGGGDYWRRWTTDYDFLYVLFTDANYKNPDPEHLTPVFAGEQFMLYRIENAQVADAAK